MFTLLNLHKHCVLWTMTSIEFFYNNWWAWYVSKVYNYEYIGRSCLMHQLYNFCRWKTFFLVSINNDKYRVHFTYTMKCFGILHLDVCSMNTHTLTILQLLLILKLLHVNNINCVCNGTHSAGGRHSLFTLWTRIDFFRHQLIRMVWCY